MNLKNFYLFGYIMLLFGIALIFYYIGVHDFVSYKAWVSKSCFCQNVSQALGGSYGS